MRKINLIIVIWIVQIGLVGNSLAQKQNFREHVSKRGTTAASFLEIGVGARALAMGGAFTALADDPSAIFWNVGGLAKLKRSGIIFNHSDWIANTNFDFLGGAFKIGRFGTVGVSITALTMGEMEVTTIDEPEGTGQIFKAGDFAVSVAYAFNLTDRFSIGFNPKVIYQYIWDMNATGVAIDVGIHYISPFKGLTMGFAMTNFGSKMRIDGENNRVLYDFDPESSGNNERIPSKLETEKWPLPLNFRIGLFYQLLNRPFHKMVLAIDAQHPNNDYESINLGFEYLFRNRFALRGGYHSLFLSDSETSFTLGAGLNYPLMRNFIFHFDFAYVDFGLLENVKKFSVSLEF